MQPSFFSATFFLFPYKLSAIFLSFILFLTFISYLYLFFLILSLHLFSYICLFVHFPFSFSISYWAFFVYLRLVILCRSNFESFQRLSTPFLFFYTLLFDRFSQSFWLYTFFSSFLFRFSLSLIIYLMSSFSSFFKFI